MKRGLIYLLLLCTSCQTFILRDGKKHRQFAPAKDRTSGKYDTNFFVRRPFEVSDYYSKTGLYQNKRIITSITGNDVKQLALTKEKYYIYFYNPTCPSTCESIKELEENLAKGENVLIISYREEYSEINKRLIGTKFAQYPYYVLANKKHAEVLLLKARDFIRDACTVCYDKYKDEVAFAECLLIQNGTIEAVMSK